MTCTRFEDEGLASIEQGHALDDHFHTCPDCIAAGQAIAGLQSELRSLGRDDAPPAGWERAVWRRIRGGPTPLWRVLWLGAPAAAALAALLFFRPSPLRMADDARATAPRFSSRIEHEGRVLRGSAAQPGDRLTMSARFAAGHHGELRVYRNDGPLVCAAAAPPGARPAIVSISCRMDAAGRYQVLALAGARPLPPSLDSLDGDAGAAVAAGASAELLLEVDVH